MSRIDNFNDTMAHRQPEHLILDLGGCPLSSMEGSTQTQLLQLLGYPLPKPQRFLFGKVQRLEIAARRRRQRRLPEHGKFRLSERRGIVSPHTDALFNILHRFVHGYSPASVS